MGNENQPDHPEHPHGAPPGQTKPEGEPPPKVNNDLPDDQPVVDNTLPDSAPDSPPVQVPQPDQTLPGDLEDQ